MRAASRAASEAAALAALTSRAVCGESSASDSAAPKTSGRANSTRDVHVGELVLDRLVAADRPAELAALLGVVHRDVQHGLAGADQLRGGRQRAELVGPRDVGASAVWPVGSTSNSRRAGSTDS